MNSTELLGVLHRSVGQRSASIDRAWAWAYVAQVVALTDMLSSEGVPPASCWVEPRMAWALDDLAFAGANTEPVPVPAVAPDDVDGVLSAALTWMAEDCDSVDPEAGQVEVTACRQSSRRAKAALRDFRASAR